MLYYAVAGYKRGSAMEKDERMEIMQARDYKVVKGNEIIQKARYDLGLAEIKTFSFIVSKIKPTDQVFTEYSFTINEYCKVLGIETNNGKNIQTVKKSLKALVDKSFFLTLENGTETTISWLNKIWIDKGSGKVRVRLDDDLQKYVTGLYKNYTQYELLCTLPMRSSYSIRIYELLKSYAFTKKHIFIVDELKRMLGCEHYERFPDFRRKVLEIAVKEINFYTDLDVSWEPITRGRKVIEILFRIKQRDVSSRFANYLNAQEAVDKENRQITLSDYLNDQQKEKSKDDE